MTLYLYSGTPGSGKSADAARDVMFALNRWNPRPVIANFDIDRNAVRHPELFHYKPNTELTAKYLFDFAERWWKNYPEFQEDFILLVIDEAQLLFNARNWTAKNRMAMLEFLSQHRKCGYRVIFISQNAKMIDNQFRMLIEYEIHHRKVANLGSIGFLLGLLTANRLFIRITTYFGMHERLETEWYFMRSRYIRLYDSYAKFDKQQQT